jgi:hypothetical protein
MPVEKQALATCCYVVKLVPMKQEQQYPQKLRRKAEHLRKVLLAVS